MKWISWNVQLTGVTELLGGMPKTEDLIQGMMSAKETRLKAKAYGRDPETIVADNMKTMGVEEGLDAALDEEKMACGFRRTPANQLALGAHQIPALLIDCATTLKYSRKYQGLKDLLMRGLVAESVVEPVPSLLPILNGTGAPTTEISGTLEWGSQIKDRMGTRAILRRYDYVQPWGLAITLRYADTGVMTNEIMHDLWEMGAVQGLGAARPRGYGRFTFELEREK